MHLVAGFPLYDGFDSLGIGPKNRGMPRPEWSRPAPFIIPTDTRTSFLVFRNYRLRRQLVAFQKRFRLLGLPLPEIRPEFDRNTSNAGMLQSEMPYLVPNCINQRKNVSYLADGLRVWSTRTGLHPGSSY